MKTISNTGIDSTLHQEVLRAAQRARLELKELVELLRSVNLDALETKDIEEISENMTDLQFSVESFTAWIKETKQTP